MNAIATIVEGDGEVISVPILLRRLSQWRNPDVALTFPTPIKVKRDRFLNRPEEFSRHLQLAAGKCGDGGQVLVLLDADDDCPAKKGRDVLTRAHAIIQHRRVAVVFANREFEAWFIGAAQSLQGIRGLQHFDGDHNADPEVPRDAKGWIKRRMPAGYGETTDQPALTAKFDMQMALDRCRSFRKLCDEWDRYVATLAPEG